VVSYKGNVLGTPEEGDAGGGAKGRPSRRIVPRKRTNHKFPKEEINRQWKETPEKTPRPVTDVEKGEAYLDSGMCIGKNLDNPLMARRVLPPSAHFQEKKKGSNS